MDLKKRLSRPPQVSGLKIAVGVAVLAIILVFVGTFIYEKSTDKGVYEDVSLNYIMTVSEEPDYTWDLPYDVNQPYKWTIVSDMEYTEEYADGTAYFTFTIDGFDYFHAYATIISDNLKDPVEANLHIWNYPNVEYEDEPSFEYSNGEPLVWDLTSNPTTGYTWVIKDDKGLDIQEDFIPPADSTMVGAPGTTVFTIDSDGPGGYLITAYYMKGDEIGKMAVLCVLFMDE